MANITEIGRKAKIVEITTTAIGFTGDFKLAGGIRNLYDKMHIQDVWSLEKNTVKKIVFCKRRVNSAVHKEEAGKYTGRL